MIHFPESLETTELQARMNMLLHELAEECHQYLEYFAVLEKAQTAQSKEDAEIQLTVFASQLGSTIEQLEDTDVLLTNTLSE